MTLRTYLDHYVRPAEYDDALRRLTDLRRLVLASPAGTGRDAAAVNLLTDAGAPRCYKITDLDGVHAGDWTPPDPGAGYLVDLGVLAKGGGALASGGVDESWIEATAARVTAAGCFLVVLTGPPAARSSKPPPTRRTCWSRSATSTPWRCWSAGYWVRSRLGIVASEPELHEPVWELLESWSREGGSGFQQRLRLTAADTVGSPFGAVRPERSLDLLARVLGDPEWRGLVTVAHSCCGWPS